MKKLSLLLLCLFICACGKETILPKEVALPLTENILQYNKTEFEYGEIIKLSEFVTNEDIELSDDYLQTEKLGNNSISIAYTKDNKDYAEIFQYKVLDTTPPIVHLQNSYSVTTDYKKELAKNIPCIDNYDKNPKCYIEGEYDTTKVGRYSLTYIGEDSSGNKTEIPFVLIVNKPSKVVYSTNRTKIEDVIKKYKDDNTMIGIDVSKWQGDINWSKVKDAGVEFAMIRIGTQKTFNSNEITEDPYFTKNIEGANAAGVKVGIYIYSYATTDKEVIDQANYIINKIKNYTVEMPIVFDWESYGSITGKGMSLTDFRNHAYLFIKTMENAGYQGMLYGSKNYLNRFWQPVKKDTWLAHYTYNLAKTNYEHEYKMWQLCSDGKVNGINEAVDIDIYYK